MLIAYNIIFYKKKQTFYFKIYYITQHNRLLKKYKNYLSSIKFIKLKMIIIF
jgi:hypothetical protein